MQFHNCNQQSYLFIHNGWSNYTASWTHTYTLGTISELAGKLIILTMDNICFSYWLRTYVAGL